MGSLPSDPPTGRPPVLSPSQVSSYLAHIGLPPSFHPSASPVLDLAYLTTLFTHHITAIPYENLIIHYSPSHAVSLDPQTLFRKIINPPGTPRLGRGGYCMEISLLFLHLLHALGFPSAYTVGVRIRPRSADGVPSGQYTGFVHLVILLTLPGDDSGQRYVLDAGFGGDGPTQPMPLVEGLVHHNSVGTQEVRYSRGWLGGKSRFVPPGDDRRLWIYEYRNGVEKGWNAFYAFDADFEFLEGDFGVMSHYTSTAEASFQTRAVLVVRFLRGEGEDGGVRVKGKVMMAGPVVKRNLGGKTEVIKVCETEAERVDALREWFGIVLTEEEAGSIRGRVSELRGEE
ncbi:arylamine N-acetyltransferase 2 [Schizothecium vesticola]|uniref:Arylamine N-acetyltransferase 2 n=1 Tax=Schizothecium vesticola TaxID=314040 RepID=A0AA40FC63_9PEZI|nr:arylamine N-acetyltransferase 2 [Schizothecium vesticola]